MIKEHVDNKLSMAWFDGHRRGSRIRKKPELNFPSIDGVDAVALPGQKSVSMKATNN